MKRIVLVCGLLASGFTYSAEWVLVAQSEDNESSYYVDKSYYKYDNKNKNSQIWVLTKNYKSTNSMEQYVSSKGLTLYDCKDKRYKNLASLAYRSDGSVLNSFNQPAKEFSVIFPDTVGEKYWEVACKSKGNGLFIPKQREFFSLKRLQDNNILPSDDLLQRTSINHN
ncbi:hypothetical protein IC797_05535 [Acinetobacter seifertii]|uniref:surface-adhesin E family protein n=1 Tax=Acinetobacter seifertii TaxID=1530123 RepID=UPI00168CDF16|nr:surface-adhesin E family protein [Acinetobacter seifertii]QNW99056.1 hypothetical protein IC797_05535 [Acinetobacter seifertii]